MCIILNPLLKCFRKPTLSMVFTTLLKNDYPQIALLASNVYLS